MEIKIELAKNMPDKSNIINICGASEIHIISDKPLSSVKCGNTTIIREVKE